jgi:hypothetical protein
MFKRNKINYPQMNTDKHRCLKNLKGVYLRSSVELNKFIFACFVETTYVIKTLSLYILEIIKLDMCDAKSDGHVL